MNTTIKTQLENKLTDKWIKVYKYLDEWNDIIYTLEEPESDHEIVVRQIVEISMTYGLFVLHFYDNGTVDLWFDNEIELMDNPENF